MPYPDSPPQRPGEPGDRRSVWSQPDGDVWLEHQHYPDAGEKETESDYAAQDGLRGDLQRTLPPFHDSFEKWQRETDLDVTEVAVVGSILSNLPALGALL